jgi:3-oxoadipate enol-lactonase
MPSAKVRDIDIFYEIQGEGDWMVMIGGMSSDHNAWGCQVPDYAKRFRLLTFDNRGAGQSSKPAGPYTIRQLADDTAALMNELGIDKAHIVGASMGGCTAQEFGINYPEKTRSLSMYCSWAKCDNYLASLIDSWRRLRRKVDLVDLVREAFLWMYSPKFYDERWDELQATIRAIELDPNPQPAEAYWAQADAAITHDTLARLGQIKAPTHVVVGAIDIFTPLRFSKQVADGIPGSKLTVLDGAPHHMFFEIPEEFNAKTLAFIEANNK